VGRVVVYASAGLLAVVLLISAAAGGVVAAIFGSDPAAAALACSATVTNPGAAPAGLRPEQAHNAAVIITVGQRMGIPVRGWVIAVATALQESDLINSGTATDHDSLGLFQQRPSQGWGTPAQLTDPAYASAAFYTALRHVPGWETLPLTVAAQRVQRSAYPDAYAKQEPRATAIVAAYTGGAVCDGGDGTTGAGVALPPGFTLPAGTPPQVVTAIGWALAQLGTPYSFGGDCTAAHSGDSARECDCSSLVMGAYRAAGVSLPRVTGDQVHAGTPVAGLANARPGDLIFIPGSGGSMTNPDHVGLYLGSGILVQAPHTGDVVKISPVSGWANQIAAIRRIVPS
jgi:cell wall-associated NlpC family hydrolase